MTMTARPQPCSVIRIDPKNADAYYNRGIAYRQKGNYSNTIIDFDQAIKIDPKNADVYNHRGIPCRVKEDCGRAIVGYDKPIKIDTNNAGIYNNRSCAYHENRGFHKFFQLMADLKKFHLKSCLTIGAVVDHFYHEPKIDGGAIAGKRWLIFWKFSS